MGFKPSEGIDQMLTLQDKLFVLMYVAPFFAFYFGMLYQKASRGGEDE